MRGQYFGLNLLVFLLLPFFGAQLSAQSKTNRDAPQSVAPSPRRAGPANGQDHPQRYGLLVSFALQPEGERQEEFRTLWFVIDAKGTRIEAKVDGIVVPRSQGFWFVGLQAAEVESNPEWHKEDSTDSENSIFTTSEEYPFAVPFGQNPPEKKKIPESGCSEHWQTGIQLVSPDFAAYGTQYSRLCGMGSNDPVEESSWNLSPVDDLTKSVSLFGYFSTDEKLAICALFSKSSIQRKCLAGKIQFGIKAGYSSWSVVPEDQYAGFLTNPIPVPLPSRIVGYKIHWPSDPTLRQAVEKADGIPSPDCKWIFSTPGYVFRFYHPGQLPTDNSDLHPLPLRFSRVVLAQWAMGSHVAEWDQKIKALPQGKN